MFKKILLLTTYFVGSLSAVCYYQPDITNSNILFTYKGNVYDITGYKHPGGQGPMNQLVGNDLELFVNANSKSFHLTPGNKFFTDLNTLFVGVLCDVPIVTTLAPPIPVVTTIAPPIPVVTTVYPTVSVVTTTSIPVTTISCTTTSTTDMSNSNTDTSIPVTENTTFGDLNIANNSSNIKNDLLVLIISTILGFIL